MLCLHLRGRPTLAGYQWNDQLSREGPCWWELCQFGGSDGHRPIRRDQSAHDGAGSHPPGEVRPLRQPSGGQHGGPDQVADNLGHHEDYLRQGRAQGLL